MRSVLSEGVLVAGTREECLKRKSMVEGKRRWMVEGAEWLNKNSMVEGVA